jgi:hypothetical protein
MSHLDIRYCVRGEITSTDADLLDTIASQLPDETDVILGTEYSQTRVSASESDNLDTDQERLSARLTFAGEPQEVDGTEVTPEQAATGLVNKLTGHDLATRAEDWEVEMYRTPEGAVRAQDVQAWYEANPKKQPDSEDPDSGVPDSWDPENHVVRRESS